MTKNTENPLNLQNSKQIQVADRTGKCKWASQDWFYFWMDDGRTIILLSQLPKTIGSILGEERGLLSQTVAGNRAY